MPDMALRVYGWILHSRRSDQLAGTRVTDSAVPLVRTSPSTLQVSE
uniref:Uncharacterized protein n=1 Tax=Arundo donax TaxID=35708 RepID=A0A0A8YPR5_ARUDO